MAAISIQDQLKALMELQKLDAQLYGLKRELSQHPARAAALKDQHERAAEGLKAEEAHHKGLEVKRNQMEIDLAGKETQTQKLQAQLYQVKTNKEYSAMQKEIEGAKADRSVLEEEILKLMEEIDRAKARISSEREALKAQEETLQRTLAELETRAQQIETSLKELQAARVLLTPRVEPPVLSRYEKILANKEGLALVPVVKESCGGCHIVLPPQMINEIHMGERLITCESCARILTLEPSE
ncbi:MAG: hypothetical protein HYZ90_02455 [Candidatus Omnitrophica bacterium]|nr:hypothetical protein [Candidatus Omnitrophota bacterium]